MFDTTVDMQLLLLPATMLLVLLPVVYPLVLLVMMRATLLLRGALPRLLSRSVRLLAPLRLMMLVRVLVRPLVTMQGVMLLASKCSFPDFLGSRVSWTLNTLCKCYANLAHCGAVVVLTTMRQVLRSCPRGSLHSVPNLFTM